MDYHMIKTAADKIAMSPEMKQRIIRDCRMKQSTQMEENNMNHHNSFRKPAAILVMLAICLTVSVTALAATGTRQGYFRDIMNHWGAVTGTSYEEATAEIGVNVTVCGNELTALATFTDPQMIPYKYAEKLGIAAFQIVDANGKVVKEGAAESTEIVNGQAAMTIHLDGMENGTYKLVVTAFVSEKKADQPLNLNGYWECEFVK